jgi:hypothetical protein
MKAFQSVKQPALKCKVSFEVSLGDRQKVRPRVAPEEGLGLNKKCARAFFVAAQLKR